ncbi:MAG TPA: hypothetical protein VGX23_05550 [Actinocrinis sp.]|nr:hypothetical protein [Actinocrinis sp.]
MTAGHRASVHWAVSSKPPGGFDRKIVRASAPEIAGPLGGLLEAVHPGTPDQAADARAALPWVTVVNFSTRDSTAPQVGVCATGWGVGVDSGNRPITRTRIFALPAPTGPAPYPGYRAMWEALREWDLGEEANGPITVDLPAGVEPDRELFLRAGTTFEWAAAVAAALLDRRVLITDYPGQDPSQALGVIDAVVSLLPRGLHQEFRAGTWTKNNAVVTDLAFASATLGCPPDSCWKIAWGAPEPISPALLSEDARQYLGHLTALYHEYQSNPLPIVQGLAAADAPHGLNGCAPWALSVVEQLDLPLLTHRAIVDREGRVRRGQDGRLSSRITTPAVLANVTAVLHRLDAGQVPPDRAEALAEYLAWCPDPSALATVPVGWWTAAVEFAARLRRWRLRERDEWRAEGPSSVAWFVNAVELSRVNAIRETGEKADVLWSTLLHYVTDEPLPAEGFTRLWTAWPSRTADPLPRTAKLLAEREALARRVLLRECETSPSGALGLLALLDSCAPSEVWYTPLRTAYRDEDSEADPAQIARFCEADPDHPVLLLRLAAITNRLEPVAERAGDGLITAALVLRQRGERKSPLELVVQEPVRDTAGPYIMALTDLIRWILGLAFTGSCITALQEWQDAAAYVDALLDLTEHDRAAHRLRPQFAAFLATRAFDKAKELPGWTEPVLSALLRAGGEAAQQVAGAVAKAAPKDQHLSKLLARFDREFTVLLAQHGGPAQQRFLRTGLLADLAEAVRAGHGEPVAQACTDALRGGCLEEEVFAGLAALSWCADVDRVRALLARVPEASDGAAQGPAPITARAQEFALGGGWGEPAARRFAERMISELTERESHIDDRIREQLAAFQAQEWEARQVLEDLNQGWSADQEVIGGRAEEELDLARGRYRTREEASLAAEEKQILEIRRRGMAERQVYLQEYQTQEGRITAQRRRVLVAKEKEYQQAAVEPGRQRDRARKAAAGLNAQAEADRAAIAAEITRIRWQVGAGRQAKPAGQTKQRPDAEPREYPAQMPTMQMQTFPPESRSGGIFGRFGRRRGGAEGGDGQDADPAQARSSPGEGGPTP